MERKLANTKEKPEKIASSLQSIISGIKSKFDNFLHGKPEQHTQVYCKCRNELVADAEKSFIRDVYVKILVSDAEKSIIKDYPFEFNVVHYKCSKCGKDSY